MELRYPAVILALGIAWTGQNVTLDGASPGSEAMSQSGSPSIGGLPPRATSRANPYSRLFPAAKAAEAKLSPPDGRDASKPRVVCGMTIVPADPNIDPGIAVSPPTKGPRFTIRAIDPPICR